MWYPRASSKKTRIETLHDQQQGPSADTIRGQVPRKQGLKLLVDLRTSRWVAFIRGQVPRKQGLKLGSEPPVLAIDKNPRASSKKTRIETR